MAGEIYSLEGPTRTWAASGGTALLTLTSVGFGTLRGGAAIDLGTSAREFEFVLEANLNYASALSLNTVIADIWLLESDDNSIWPGNLTSGDAAVGSGKVANFGTPLLTLLADSTSNGEWQRKRSGLFQLRGRYVMPVVRNSHTSINMDGTDIGFLTLYSYYAQIQP